MRTAKQFQTELVKMMRREAEHIADVRDEREKLKAASLDSKKYGPDSMKAFSEEASNAYSEIMRTLDRVKLEVDRMCAEYSAEIDAADALNPAEMTDDIKLLNCGVTMSANDLRGILNRNEGNATMRKLVFKYADQNGIILPADRVTFADERNAVRSMQAVASTLFKPSSVDTVEKTFAKVFGAEA